MQEQAATPAPARSSTEAGGRGALLVAAGILLSRVMGLVRERVFAHYLGNSLAAGAFKAALRIPNFLQNLFGEGVLSASFIPVYAGLLGKAEREEAERVAGGVFGLLALLTGVLTAAGLLATPLMVDVIAPGLEGGVRELTVRLVRILFPGVGLLVMSAWCLGILNSHRRFFLSYAAPVLWNLALIATLVGFGTRLEQDGLVVALAWGAVAGSILQFLVQLPEVLRLLGRLRPSLGLGVPGVRRVVSAFGPVVVGRGVVQLSAYVDTALATLVSARALAALTYAQTLYLLPVSLFGMSVSAAELPEMARASGDLAQAKERVRERLRVGSRRITFLVIPSAAALLLLGDVVTAALLQTGAFGPADTRFVWYLLMGATVGLVASTLGRLYASALYAMGDPRTPLRFAVARVALGGSLAATLVLGLRTGLPDAVRTAFLPAASGLAAWLEFLLLRAAVRGRVGEAGKESGRSVRLWVAALGAACSALGVKAALVHATGVAPGLLEAWGGAVLPAPALNPVLTAALVLGTFGLVYFGIAHLLGITEASTLGRRVLQRVRRR
ncbi:MAG: murein biosynthesis integral membrane protein MurJ [Myxococcaceae bacterium]|nr:murein biosynthesis integral membrane protein MurJ [Myxococcaceae bacterium]MCI0670692.1 murein biosynthesis integral membrane protein MurJ [Myxococcaceae bacterium]